MPNISTNRFYHIATLNALCGIGLTIAGAYYIHSGYPGINMGLNIAAVALPAIGAFLLIPTVFCSLLWYSSKLSGFFDDVCDSNDIIVGCVAPISLMISIPTMLAAAVTSSIASSYAASRFHIAICSIAILTSLLTFISSAIIGASIFELIKIEDPSEELPDISNSKGGSNESELRINDDPSNVSSTLSTTHSLNKSDSELHGARDPDIAGVSLNLTH